MGPRREHLKTLLKTLHLKTCSLESFAQVMGNSHGGAGVVAQEDALPGRSTAMKLSNTHYVLKTPMKGPWPAGFEIIIFGNGACCPIFRVVPWIRFRPKLCSYSIVT